MKKKTFYHLILDKSGSMSDCIKSTINGFNEQVQAIQSLESRYPDQEILVGLTTFNNDVDQVFSRTMPNELITLTTKIYRPNGTTALLDAIGMTVRLIQETPGFELNNPENTVVVVIITDGYENASKIYNLETVRHLISSLEASGQWTFSYLGATLDAVDIAEKMAIKSQNSMAFDKASMNNQVWSELNCSMDDYFSKKTRNEDTSNFLKKGK